MRREEGLPSFLGASVAGEGVPKVGVAFESPQEARTEPVFSL